MATDPPVITLRDIVVGFGGDPLFEGAALQLTPGMRAVVRRFLIAAIWLTS